MSGLTLDGLNKEFRVGRRRVLPLDDASLREQLPAEAFKTPDTAEGSLAERLRRTAGGMLAVVFVESGV